MTSHSIYLDNHATTPCDPRVVEAMLPYFTQWSGNPGSILNSEGQRAQRAIDQARLQIATLIHAEPHEIIFTSGASESNNMALLGTALQYGAQRRRIVTTPIEHKAILEPCRWLITQGYEIVYLNLLPDGQVDLEHAAHVITEATLLVSVQTANNEIGTLQPIESLGNLAREVGAFFHSDAAQAVSKIEVDVQRTDVDFLSLSAHKMYGPKGVGALYIRGGPRMTPIHPLMWGGGQEQGLRPGTLNVPAIVGFGEAARLCAEELPNETVRLAQLRDTFEISLKNVLGEKMHINGAIESRLPNNSSLLFRGVDAETLLLNVPQLSLSLGSACTSGALEPSYVLTAIGLSREEAYQTIRIGFGRFNTSQDVEAAVSYLLRSYAFESE